MADIDHKTMRKAGEQFDEALTYSGSDQDEIAATAALRAEAQQTRASSFG